MCLQDQYGFCYPLLVVIFHAADSIGLRVQRYMTGFLVIEIWKILVLPYILHEKSIPLEPLCSNFLVTATFLKSLSYTLFLYEQLFKNKGLDFGKIK